MNTIPLEQIVTPVGGKTSAPQKVIRVERVDLKTFDAPTNLFSVPGSNLEWRVGQDQEKEAYVVKD